MRMRGGGGKSIRERGGGKGMVGGEVEEEKKNKVENEKYYHLSRVGKRR